MANLENLERLAQWLDAGAPHIRFDMSKCIDWDLESSEPDCGTVCCIAGAAKLMSTGSLGKPLPEGYEPDWELIREDALTWLGLSGPSTDRWMGNDLFDPALAPCNCTPAQAAVAVRRVMDGKEPWS